MPQKVTPDIIRYYQERIKEMQVQIDNMWKIMRIQREAHVAQASLPMFPHFRSVWEAHKRRWEQDTATEISRLNNMINDLKGKVNMWIQQNQR